MPDEAFNRWDNMHGSCLSRIKPGRIPATETYAAFVAAAPLDQLS